MEWNCSECTYINSYNDTICVVCGRGYRLFSPDTEQNNSFIIDDESEFEELENPVASSSANQSNEQDSLLTWTDEDPFNVPDSLLTWTDEDPFNVPDSLLTWTDEDPSNVPDSSSNSSDEVEGNEEDSLLGTSRKRKDIYVRHDGELLYGQDAADERKRSIARRKALDLQKLFANKRKQPSTFSVNVLKASATDLSTHAFASASKGHFNALTAHAKGANASASATAEVASISVANVHATGANASASASHSGVRVNALNMNATGVSTSVSANADVLSVAAGNISVTGAEAVASASVSGARVTVGNVDITGASAGASAKVNGTGISAFNVCVGGPSAAASVNVDEGLSFGNINLGLRPSLDIGFGFNIGIPFLSGSRLGSSGGGGGDNSNSNANNNGGGNGANQGRLAGLQQRLSEKYPNRRYCANPVDYPITHNKSGEPINPLLPEDGVPRTDSANANVDNVVNRHNELVKDGKKFVGFKGCPPTSASSSIPQTSVPSNAPSTNNNTGGAAGTGPTEEKIWSGMYTSPSPEVAKGYANDDRGRPGTINRVYVPEDTAKLYSTNIGLETAHGKGALRAVKEHSNGRYIFSGPQDSKNPDLFAPETVISPAVRDEALATGTMKFEPSAHEIDRSSYKVFKEYHKRELKCSEMVPDYIVGVKTADDCARDGGRERLAHVFQGQPPYGSDNVSSKKKELSEDDKLLLEECRQLGFEISPDDLDACKKELKSDEEYEREEDAQNRTRQRDLNTTAGGNSGKGKEQEESENKPQEPCKDHSNNFRCMKCLNGSSGPRIRPLDDHVHGFKWNE